MDSTVQPRLTVVIPTRNRAHLLPRAIRSVLGQGEDVELVVVDDASTDQTAEYLKSVDDRRLRHFRCERPKGAAGARNVGIRAARTELISFLDDDDELLETFKDKILTTMDNHPAAGFCWCGTERVEDDGNGWNFLHRGVWQPDVSSTEEAHLLFLAHRRVGTGCGLTVRREVFELSGYFDERLRCAEDTDLLIRLAKVVPFVVVPEVLIRVHVHEGPRLTRYGADSVDAYRRIAAKHAETLAEHSRIDQQLHYKIGWMAMHAGRPREGRRELLGAWLRAPWRLKPLGMLMFFTLAGRWGPKLHLLVSEHLQGRKVLPTKL